MTDDDSEDHEERRGRALTDADIEAIADVLEMRLINRFYRNLGRGVWGLAKKGAVTVLLILAAYGGVTQIASIGGPHK